MKSDIKSYLEFKRIMESKLPNHKPVERVAYMLRHPVHLKMCGGNYQMLSDYILMEIYTNENKCN